MSELNIKKMKVAELREELANRDLDTKGTKPVLLKRLEEAILEEGNSVADESVLNETSEVNESTDATEANTEAESLPEAEAEATPEVEPEPAAEPEPEPATELEPEPAEEAEEEEAEAIEAEETEAASEAVEAAEEKVEEAESTAIDEAEEEEAMAEDPVAEDEETGQEDIALEQEEALLQEDDDEEPKEAGGDANEAEQTETMETNDNAETKEAEGADEEHAIDTEALDEQVGEFQVMDSVGDDDPEEKEKRGEKRRHDDREVERDRDRRRHHRRSRSRSSDRRKRSPQRRRDRSRSPRDSSRHRRRSSSPKRRSAPEPEENEDWLAATNVQLDRFNCDLNIRVNDDGYKCCPITVEGFAFMWSGVRANYGISKGKAAFEVKLVENLNVDHLPSDETSRHLVRVGFSTDATTMSLGEEELSYGYGGSGKCSTGCKFEDYGQKFTAGDTITAYLDMDAEEVEISFAKNGEDLGKCFGIDRETLAEAALIPHILSKNTEFEVNFGQKETPWQPLKEGFVFFNDLSVEDRVRGTLPPAKKEDCEFLMMCGLPGCGKSTWSAKHNKENPEKRYTVLGTNNLIDKMKVMGLPRKKNYGGRWDVLIDKSTKCLNRLLDIASKKKRNFILDQTNVYPRAQRRKMRPFEGFQRRAIVIVPTDEEFKRRCAEREEEEGKEVPDAAVLEMKANFELPDVGDLFDGVEFVELDREEAQKVVSKYNEEAKAALPPPEKRYHQERYGSRGGGGSSGGGHRDYRSGGYDRDRRSGGYVDRGYDRRGGNRGGYDRDRRGGGYMGYSSSDRRRAESSHDSRDRRDPRDSRSGGWGHKGWGSQGGGGWGGGGQGGWGGNQGGWNQGGWAQQGYGSGGGSGNWGGGQWGGYNQGNWSQQGQQGWGGSQSSGSYGGYGQSSGSGSTGQYNYQSSQNQWPSATGGSSSTGGSSGYGNYNQK